MQDSPANCRRSRRRSRTARRRKNTQIPATTPTIVKRLQRRPGRAARRSAPGTRPRPPSRRRTARCRRRAGAPGADRPATRSPVSTARAAPQHPQADERGQQRRDEEQEQVGVAEQQPVAQHVRVGHPRPRQREPEHERRRPAPASASRQRLDHEADRRSRCRRTSPWRRAKRGRGSRCPRARCPTCTRPRSSRRSRSARPRRAGQHDDATASPGSRVSQP